MPARLTLLILACWSLLAQGAYAEDTADTLKWEGKKFAIQARPADEKAVVTYRFRNDGDTPVTVATVRTTCGCIVAKSDKKVYAPGDTGAVTATFWFGNRSGRHVNQIWVVYGGDQARQTALELDVTIPPLLKIEPLTLVWSPDDATQPKIVSVRNAYDKPVHISSVACDPALVNAKIEPVKDGHDYRITVTPVVANGPVETALTIISDFPADSPRIFHVRVVIHGASDQPLGKK